MRHLDTYLADALEATDLSKDERTGRRERWKRKLTEEDDAIDSIEDELRWWEDEPAVDAALTYIDNRRERMNYAQARRQNLPVASGHVEATCKSLVQVRMRRSGQRWTKPSARAILNLRTLALSDTWSEGVELLTDKLVDEHIERHDALCQRYAA